VLARLDYLPLCLDFLSLPFDFTLMSLHSLGVKLQVVDLTVKFPGVQIILLNSVVFLDSALQVRRVDLHAA